VPIPMCHTKLTMALVAALGFIAPGASHAADTRLALAAKNRSMIWNAVAVDRGRIFVAGPRWTGSTGPALALIDRHGRPQPYPDAAWNGWRPGADASHAFVDVNAIHRDDHGGLWAVDTGSPQFGGDPIRGAAKLVQIDLASGKVRRVIPFGADIALKGSYVDDVRFHGAFAYLTDAGRPGIIVVNLMTGAMRRVLNDIPATTAPADRQIVVAGARVISPDGTPLRVHTDPMEVSPDGATFYFGTLEGPWSRIETRWLDDFSASAEAIADKVEPWIDLPPVGGTAMDSNGDLYFSDLATSTLKRRTPNGQVTSIVRDERLHWVDAPFIDDDHHIWLPVPQMDRTAIFNGGRSRIAWPIRLYKVALPKSR
jgi:hypothetical protein